MQHRKRKIAVFTGNRAEYGLQYPILKAIDKEPALEYYLLVSGAHLDEDFGRTVTEIARDGFRIFREVKLEMTRDTLYATAQAIATGILSLSATLDELKPDLLLVYADRFEGFSAVITGSQMGIPTAHVEGGDITEGGALDDSVRHAMTKLAHIHFTTNEDAARRIKAMGEEDWRVFNVGFPAIDLIAAGEYATPEEIARKYGVDPERALVVFTQHSVATEFEKADAQVRPSLEAMEILARKNCQVVITYPNNDAGGRRIIREIQAFAQRGIPGIQFHRSLGRFDYHGLLNICGRVGRGVCVGNSSSGIKETPALGCPTVNIGSRQKGRLRATNILDVGYDRDAIAAAVLHSLEDEGFRARCRDCQNPYGVGNAGPKIAGVLSSIELGPRLIQKRMVI